MEQVTDLEHYFQQIPDRRRRQGRRYNQAKLLTVVVISILNNAQSYREMSRFMKNNLEELKKYFGWDRNRTPSHELIRTTLNELEFNQINQVFSNWISDNVSLEENDWIAFDGKAIRSSLTDYQYSSQDFVNMVTAFSHRLQISIDQDSFQNKKSHEGSAIINILDRLNQKGLVVTMDALHCKKKL